MSLLSRRRRADLSCGTVVEVVRGVPRFGLLLYRLMLDGRVSRLDRALFALALGYAVTPRDLIPDWVPGLGRLDDLVIVTLALYRLLHRTERKILLDHWEGDADPLHILQDLLDRAVKAAPWWTRSLARAG